MEYAIWLGLFLPLAGFLVLLFSSRTIDRKLTGLIGCGTVFLSFLCFSWLLYHYVTLQLSSESYTLFSWVPLKNIQANFTVTLDHLSLVMTLIITGVGFLIHLYSVGYMDHHPDYARFFACLNLFVFAMLLLVLAGHLLLLFVGWEGVGLASYLLIGFYYTKHSAAKAATKAFVINRVGDLGFLLGVILIFYMFGTGNIAHINTIAPQKYQAGNDLVIAATLLLFWGATAKSAQIPLHTWLADAMEGPTPVSALIHAATMVTAGVYLVVRMHTLYMLAPLTMQVIGVVGGVTSLFAALCALGQIDLKRVLAYSTVSQLGLMFLACGAGAFYSAMFHLTTHAFVKALLFLSAGNVVHMMDGLTDMRQMGGLRKLFPVTHWFFLIGALALAGIPPLATFFSKDLILEQEHLAGFTFLYYISLAASILTGFYLMRAYCLTFLGDPNWPDGTVHKKKEVPGIMLTPVAILALLSAFGGFLSCTFCETHILEEFLRELGISKAELEVDNSPFFTPEMIVAISGSVLGVVLSTIIYTRFTDRLGNTWQILKKAFYFDAIYWTLFGLPLKKLGNFIANFIEPKVLESSVTGIAETVQGTAGLLQYVQSGQLRSYVAWMILGVVIVAYLVVWGV